MFRFGSKKWPGLAKLNEECGELVQVIGKLMQVKGRRKHWSGDLRVKLVEELADVQAAVAFVRGHCLTDEERQAFYARVDVKVKKFQGWRAEGGK